MNGWMSCVPGKFNCRQVHYSHRAEREDGRVRRDGRVTEVHRRGGEKGPRLVHAWPCDSAPSAHGWRTLCAVAGAKPSRIMYFYVRTSGFSASSVAVWRRSMFWGGEEISLVFGMPSCLTLPPQNDGKRPRRGKKKS